DSYDGNRSVVCLGHVYHHWSPEVVAYAAEPMEVAASTASFSAAVMPATVSPEVAAEAAEPHKTGTSALAPCTVVAPNDMHPACGSSSHPVPAMEAVYELSAPPVTAMEAVTELTACPVTAMEATYELSAHPVTARDAVIKFSPCPELAMEAMNELSAHPLMAIEAIIELSAPSVSGKNTNHKLSTCLAPTETAHKPSAFSASLLVALSASSVPVFPRSQSMTRVPAPPWWAPAPPWRALALPAPPRWAPGLPAPP
ncbi:hypothetical protein M9458_045239, partial [Cirrhinus mrigala]